MSSDCTLCGKHPRRKYSKYCDDCRQVIRRRYNKTYDSNPRERFRKRVMGKVHAAIKKGILTRSPCIICGEPQTHAHHADYRKPLEVTWLCAKHHTQLHQIIRSDPDNEVISKLPRTQT